MISAPQEPRRDGVPDRALLADDQELVAAVETVGPAAVGKDAGMDLKRPRAGTPPCQEANNAILTLSQEDAPEPIELVPAAVHSIAGTTALAGVTEPSLASRRVEGEAYPRNDVPLPPLTTFPSAPIVAPSPPHRAVVKVPVPPPQQLSTGQQPPHVGRTTPGSSPVTPSSRPPVKSTRKTPVSTPSSSVVHTPASLPGSSFAAGGGTLIDQKRAGRVERWAELLLPAMLQDAESHEEAARRDLCRRIAGAIGGDRQEAKDTFMMLLVNLKDEKNTALRARLASGELPVEVLVTLDERDLVNPERRKKLDEEFEERAKDTNLVEIRKAAMTSSTMFPCPRCKARDCSWTQKQTRSADEPMTVFCFCNKCNYVWKKY